MFYPGETHRALSLIGNYKYIDFDGDGKQELIIRERSSIRGKYYHVLYFFEKDEIDLTKTQQWADFKNVPTVAPRSRRYKTIGGGSYGPIVGIDLIVFEGEVFLLLLPYEHTKSEFNSDEVEKVLAVFDIKNTALVKDERNTTNIQNLCLFNAKKSLIINTKITDTH
jgi:hypothetical protein